MIREQHKLNLIGVKKQVTRMVKGRMVKDNVFNFTPTLDDVIEKGDVLVVIGKEEDLDRFCAME
jgi:Trk K+ transport system NAD-binding subunit